MIVRVKGGTASGKRAGYLALRCNADDEWVPVTGRPTISTDKALEQCRQHIREQITQAHVLLARRLRAADVNLEHLTASPSPDDVIRIRGQTCQVNDNGMLTMPKAPRQTARGRICELPDLIDDALYQMLHKAMNLPHKREIALALMVDHVLETPFDMLVQVAQMAPNELGTVAEFMVRVFQASESVSATEDHGANVEPEGGDT